MRRAAATRTAIAQDASLLIKGSARLVKTIGIAGMGDGLMVACACAAVIRR